MDNIELNSFPSDVYQALAITYINTLDLKGKTPEEILRIYDEAYTRIKAENIVLRQEKKAARNS